MAQAGTKLPVKTVGKSAPATAPWHPFNDLRREVDRLFGDFNGGWFQPFNSRLPALRPLAGRDIQWNTPAVDVAETQNAYEITAELPGMDPEHVEVMLRNGNLVIVGEKQEESEQKAKDYYLHERQFGSFERTFTMPEGVDPEKIEATFQKGVLTVSLPKTAAVQKPPKKIKVKAT